MRHKMRILLVLGALLMAGFAAGTAGAAGPPPRPKSAPHISDVPQMMLLVGHGGKPIIGKNGKPIMIPVGLPPLPSAGNSEPVTPDQAAAAEARGPEEARVPDESDLEKARRLAPDQAP